MVGNQVVASGRRGGGPYHYLKIPCRRKKTAMIHSPYTTQYCKNREITQLVPSACLLQLRTDTYMELSRQSQGCSQLAGVE